MAQDDFSSWRLTDQERRRLNSALLDSLAGFVPGGPGIVWGVEYFYNRRHLIFNRSGRPLRAYNSQGQPLRLNSLAQGSGPRPATLSLNVGLTSSAAGAGLRDGDPVTIVLTGQVHLRTPSGLLVPARVNEPVNLALPQGSYSLAAFGSRREALFTAPDPVTALGGNSLVLGGPARLAVPLTARTPLLAGQPAPAPLAACNCAQCQAARGQASVTGCNCAQCQAARVQAPATGCNCAQCQAARVQAPGLPPIPACNCAQCQAARGPVRSGPCGCAQCRAARVPPRPASCDCATCRASRGQAPASGWERFKRFIEDL